MKNFINIALFTFVVSLVYTGIAQVLPQLEGKPPPKVEFGANTSPSDLAAAGAEVFQGPCTACHKLNEAGRGPALGTIGAAAQNRAAERGITDVEYLVEALCKPGDYVLEGFANIMPPQQANLKPGQLQALVAYLQSLGGDATVKGTDTQVFEDYGCGAGSGGAAAGGGAVAAAPKPVGSPEEVFAEFGCIGCHAIDSDKAGIGPSLKGIGKRMDKWEILDAVLDPDAVIADGYEGGVMGGALAARNFYSRMSGKDHKAFVDWLATK
jgi:cytochrome c2